MSFARMTFVSVSAALVTSGHCSTATASCFFVAATRTETATMERTVMGSQSTNDYWKGIILKYFCNYNVSSMTIWNKLLLLALLWRKRIIRVFQVHLGWKRQHNYHRVDLLLVRAEIAMYLSLYASIQPIQFHRLLEVFRCYDRAFLESFRIFYQHEDFENLSVKRKRRFSFIFKTQ